MPSIAYNSARQSSPRPSAPPSSGTTSSSTAPPPDWSFRKLFFPNADPLTGTLAGVQHLLHRLHRPADRRRDLRPLRRPHRPQGDADRHAAGDGHRHVPDRLRAELRLDRHLGRRHPDRAARAAGHRRRRRMGRLGADLDGMVAQPRQPRARRVLAAIRRAVGPVPVQPRGPRRSAPGRAPISPPGAGASRSCSASS